MPIFRRCLFFSYPFWRASWYLEWETSIAGDECCHSSCWWSTGWNSELRWVKTLQSVVHCGCSQKTARGELKGCILPRAFHISNNIITYIYIYKWLYNIHIAEGCEHILIYIVSSDCIISIHCCTDPVEVYCSSSIPNLFQLPRSAQKIADLKLKRSSYWKSINFEP